MSWPSHLVFNRVGHRARLKAAHCLQTFGKSSLAMTELQQGPPVAQLRSTLLTPLAHTNELGRHTKR